MKVLTVEKRKVDAKALRYQVADPDRDFNLVVDRDTDVMVGGELVVSYRVLEILPVDLLRACQSIEYNETARTDGLVTRSRTFGFLPRVTLRRDFCTSSSMSTQHPEEHAIFCDTARMASAAYRMANPRRWERQSKALEAVLPEWRIAGTPFTSGIVNQSNSLRYHKDAGNFADLWSVMVAFSADIEGGLLAVPELDLAFSFARPAMIMFDGASLVHAVTPIARRSSMAYRYSIVFYAMKAMCNCLAAPEELARIRRVKTAREIARVKGPAK